MKSKKALWVALGLAAVLILVIAANLSSGPSPSAARDHFSKDTDSDTNWPDDASASRRSDADDMADQDSSSVSAAGKSSDNPQSQEVTDPDFGDALKNGLPTREEDEAKTGAINSGAGAPGEVNITRRTRTVEIPDPASGIVASRFEIPADWSFDGILIRDEGCGLTPTIAWRISSPDGRYGAQLMPEFGSHWSDNPYSLENFQRFHCKIMEPVDAEEFLREVAPFVRPNPTIGPMEPTDDAGQLQQGRDLRNRQAMARNGFPGETGSAVRSRIQYVYRGETMEERFAVRLFTFENRSGFPGGPVTRNWLTLANVRTFRAPQGQLDEVLSILFPMLGASAYGFTPEFDERFRQKVDNDRALTAAALQRQAAMSQAMLAQNAAAFQAAQTQNHEDGMKRLAGQFNIGQQQWQSHMDYMTRSAQAYTLYAGDNQLVRNPQTGMVSTVTNKYGTNAWQENGTNNILLMNPNDVNPNLYLRGTYTQLENVDPMKPN
jgi:hypothetical protein